MTGRNMTLMSMLQQVQKSAGKQGGVSGRMTASDIASRRAISSVFKKKIPDRGKFDFEGMGLGKALRDEQSRVSGSAWYNWNNVYTARVNQLKRAQAGLARARNASGPKGASIAAHNKSIYDIKKSIRDWTNYQQQYLKDVSSYYANMAMVRQQTPSGQTWTGTKYEPKVSATYNPWRLKY